MLKDKAKKIVNYIIKHSKIAFPVIVVAAVAVTVSVALNAGKKDKLAENGIVSEEESGTEATDPTAVPDDPMAQNEDAAITELINSSYNGVTTGDADILNSVCDEISTQDMLSYQERSKYIDHYSTFEIYTKPGLEAGSTIVFVYCRVVFVDHPEEYPGYSAYYVCTNEQGNLYIKRSDFTDEQAAYLGEVMSQDDVVEFNNRVIVEYKELMKEHPELLEYLNEMDQQVNAAVGVELADQNATETQPDANAEGQEAQGTDTETPDANTENPEQTADTPVENVVQYVTTTATVNVRSSDSEKADKMGKVSQGTQLQVVEERVNGWTKILFDGKEGFIKSEYLEAVESAAGMESIGIVTATTNINVRSSASETADRLGVLAGGDSAELLANENGWCKIKYNGKVGYVKSDYVQ